MELDSRPKLSVYRLLAIFLSVAWPACGSDEFGDEIRPTFDEPVYALLSRVVTLGAASGVTTPFKNLESPISLGPGMETLGRAGIQSFNGFLYLFEDETLVVTRYRITDDLDFISDPDVDRVSFAATGIPRFRWDLVAFASDTKAYYADPPTRSIYIWNPTSMELLDTIDLVAELEKENFPDIDFAKPLILGNTLVLSVVWENQRNSQPLQSVGFVTISTQTDSFIELSEDSRCGVGTDSFVLNGQYYHVGNWRTGLYEIYLPLEFAPPCLVRWDPATRRIDSGFFLNLGEVLGTPHIGNAGGIDDNTFAAQLYESPIDPNDIPTRVPDPLSHFSQEYWRWALVDLDTATNEVNVARTEDLELTSTTSPPVSIDDTVLLFLDDEDTGSSQLLRLDSAQGALQATELATVTGFISTVVRIR